MVLGILTAVGVTFVAGYITRALQTANTDREHDQQRGENLQRRLKELEKKHPGCCYLFTFILLFAFLISLGVILYVTNFFRSQKHLTTVLLDWKYWLNYDNFKIFNYNYTGIAGVAMAMVLVIFPLLYFLFKLCLDVSRHEKELKEIREELQHDRRSGGDVAYAQGGWVNIAIASCFNVYCTCYITVVFASTALAFVGVVAFTCYVLYTYYSK